MAIAHFALYYLAANTKHTNDMEIALGINGRTAIFCGKKETINKILNEKSNPPAMLGRIE